MQRARRIPTSSAGQRLRQRNVGVDDALAGVGGNRWPHGAYYFVDGSHSTDYIHTVPEALVAVYHPVEVTLCLVGLLKHGVLVRRLVDVVEARAYGRVRV